MSQQALDCLRRIANMEYRLPRLGVRNTKKNPLVSVEEVLYLQRMAQTCLAKEAEMNARERDLLKEKHREQSTL